MKPKYILSTLAYGNSYAGLFMNNLLKSVLDTTNLPAVVEKYDVEFMIFTDKDTLPTITNHQNFQRLERLAKLDIHTLEWPKEMGDRYANRYGAQIQTFQNTAQRALDLDALMTYWSCDMVMAQDYFKRVLAPIEKGHDAVLSLPMRGCAESMKKYLDPLSGALKDTELFKITYENMHPLFIASHWDSPTFNKLPFTLLWNTGRGLIGHSFSSTPEVCKPNEAMVKSDRCMDAEIPSFAKNPYWATDWTDAPIVGCEPLACYYPPFNNHGASVEYVAEFAKNLPKTQRPYLDVKNYYPNFDAFAESERYVGTSVIKEIQSALQDK